MTLNDLLAQAKTIFKNLSPGKRITLLAVIACAIGGFFLLTMLTGRPDFQILYSNLAPDDAGTILTRLKEQKIAYRISSNGSSILIPKGQIYEIRLALASQGLPRGGAVGFEIFDNAKIGMTEFVQNVNYQRALQGELVRTINGFAEVESSRVHIVIPPKSLFVEAQKPSRASVVLRFRPGKWLGKGQVDGIVHLVSSSVAGLDSEDVTIVDNYGKILAGVKSRKETAVNSSSDQLTFRERVEDGIETDLRTMLEEALGTDKAIVRVSCSLDFKRHEKTEERYSPENKVIRSEQLLSSASSGAGENAMGVPGVASNMTEKKTGKGQKGGTAGFRKQDRTVNYEIGKVTSHTVEPTGKISRISVAVIVDGTYRTVKGEDEEEVRKYFPRTREEMAQLENIIKKAVNFDPKRGDEIEVANIPFENSKLRQGDDDPGEKKGWIAGLKEYASFARYGTLAIFLLFTFMFVVRPLVKWLTSGHAGGMEMLNQLPKTVEEIEREYGKGELPFQERALEMLTMDKGQSLAVMKDWLSEDQS